MNKNVLKRLLKYTAPYSSYLILSLVCAVLSVALTLTGPVLIGKAIDILIGPSNVDFSALPPVLLQLAAVIAAASVFQWLTSYFNNIIAYKTVSDIRSHIFDVILKVPLKYIDSTAHGDIINRMANDTDMISDGLLQGFTQLFTGIATILGTLIFMLRLNVKISLIVIILTPLSMFVAGFIARGSHKYFTVQTKTQGELTGYIEQMIGQQKLVKAFCYENRSQQGFEEINSRLHKCGKTAHFYSAMANPCTRFVNNIVYACVGIAGAIAAIALPPLMTVGEITVFLTYANQYTKPFNEISGIVTQLQTAFASAARVFELCDLETEKDVSSDASPEASSVILKNVYFSYTDKQKLIENFNLEVRPGQKIAVVGPTGCGKTTIINLLMRFYDVNSGSISIGGKDIRGISRSALRSNFGMVLQDTWLFSGTVKENIAYGKPNASDEEIINAAKSAYAHSFIMRLPKGYDTVISEDGSNLSQGQKQLLCIARVLLTNPKMLILDEATSNIDTLTEMRVQKAFDKMMKGRTSFVVAHRLSTIKEADVILVMENGNIIEQGSHEALMAKNGYYANLYNKMVS